MSNRTDWPQLAEEILDRCGYEADPEVAKRSLQERFEAELHNAFVAGREDVGHPAHQRDVDDLVKERDALKVELANKVSMFDVTRHRVLKALGEPDLGKSWNWIEGKLRGPATVTPLVTKDVKNAHPENVSFLYAATRNQNVRLLVRLREMQREIGVAAEKDLQFDPLREKFEDLFERDLQE